MIGHEEALQRALDARGYIVAEWAPGKPPGTIAPGMTRTHKGNTDVTEHPFVVLCETTAEDYAEQQRLTGEPCGDLKPGCVFYRFGTD